MLTLIIWIRYIKYAEQFVLVQMFSTEMLMLFTQVDEGKQWPAHRPKFTLGYSELFVLW